MKQDYILSNEELIRIGQIEQELVAIEQGYLYMLNGNETVADRLLSLSFELLSFFFPERGK